MERRHYQSIYVKSRAVVDNRLFPFAQHILSRFDLRIGQVICASHLGTMGSYTVLSNPYETNHTNDWMIDVESADCGTEKFKILSLTDVGVEPHYLHRSWMRNSFVFIDLCDDHK